MAITPISNYTPSRSNKVSFSGSRNRSSEQLVPLESQPQSHSSLNGLKKVPVIVMLAMSPITMPTAQASSTSNPEPEPIEATQSYGVSSQREPQQVGDLDLVSGKFRGVNYRCYFMKIDTDGNTRTSELLMFMHEYDKPTTYPNQKERVYGVVKQLSSKPINEAGEYVIVFERQEKNNRTTDVLCKIPKEMGEYIDKFSFSNTGINTCLPMHVSYIEKKYGKQKVANCGSINSVTNIKVKDGNEIYK